MPEFEHKQNPQRIRMIAPVFGMFVEQRFDIFYVKISALQSSFFFESFVNLCLELRIYPIAERHAETLFRSVENFVRHESAHGFAENIFGFEVLLISTPPEFASRNQSICDRAKAHALRAMSPYSFGQLLSKYPTANKFCCRDKADCQADFRLRFDPAIFLKTFSPAPKFPF